MSVNRPVLALQNRIDVKGAAFGACFAALLVPAFAIAGPRPLTSIPFTVETDMPREERIAGKIIGPGVTCLQFRMKTGEQISLEGAGLRKIVPGTLLHLTGKFARASRYMQGRAFSLRPPPPFRPDRLLPNFPTPTQS